MIELSQIWQQLLDRDRPGKTENTSKRLAASRQALAILQNEHPDLYQGESEATLSPQQVMKLNELLKDGVKLDIYRLRCQFINCGLRRGIRELGWKAALLPRIISLKRKTPPFTEKSFSALKLVRQLEEVFLRDLGKPINAETAPSRFFGQLLLSATLYGGLLHKEWVDAWLKGIPARIRSNGSSLWLDMSRQHKVTLLTGAGKKDEVKIYTLHRRWFADPLTEALIYRALNRIDWPGSRSKDFISPDTDTLPRSWGYLRGYLSYLGFGKSVLVKSQSKLLESIKIHLALQLPPAMIRYATGELAAVSLPPSAWIRLLSEKSVPVAQYIQEQSSKFELLVPKNLPDKQSASINSMALQEDILRELRNALYQKTNSKKRKSNFSSKPHLALAEVKKVENIREEEMWPIIRCLTNWMKFLLAGNRKKDSLGIRAKARQPSTVGRYLSAFANALLVEFDNRDPREMFSEDLSDAYEEAAAGKRSQEERVTAISVMARFHNYLVETMGLPLVAFSNSGGKIPAEATESANIISPAIFRSLLTVLSFGRPEVSREREVSILLAILAFRCGLRSAECRFLLMSDIQGTKKPELLIRPNILFRTKSENGTRRIPLTLLLDPQEELPRLMNWYQTRRTNENALPTDLLFAPANDDPNTPYSSDEVVEPVIKALRQVSGDQNIVFHHLRHSCATWLLFRLMTPLKEDLLCNLQFATEPLFSIAQMQSIRKSLLDSPSASRQSLYLLTLIMGHSSPAVSIRYYIHLFDLLLWLELSDQKKAVELTKDAVLAITQLTSSNIWSRHKKTGHNNWTINPYLRPMRRRWASILQDPLVASVSDIDCTLLPDDGFQYKVITHQDRFPKWRNLQRMITICQHYPHRHHEQADSWGFSVNKVNKWLERANFIGRYRTRSAEYRHLSRDGNDVHTILEHFPVPPREERDIAMVDKIFANVNVTGEENIPSIIAGIEYFLEHYNVTRGGIRVIRDCQARRYLEFLELIGVPRDYVRLLLYAPPDADMNECERMISTWGRKLNISRANCEIPNKHYDGQSGIGSIVIKVVGSREQRVKQKYFKNKPSHKATRLILPVVSYGFRYALYLLGILLDDCRVEHGLMSEKMSHRTESFRKYLTDHFVSKKTGKKLGQKGIQDAISRCKRIEKSLGIDLDTTIISQVGSLSGLIELIEMHADRFAFEGDMVKAIANLKTAAKLYYSFIDWEQKASSDI